MEVIIHRGTRQIGGTCIEVRSGRDRVLLDLGLPLPTADDPPVRGRSVASLLASGVLPRISGVYQGDDPEVLGIVTTHAHGDHFGLASYAHPSIPIHATGGTWAAQRTLEVFTRAPALPQEQRILKPGRPLRLGALTVRAVAVDHSGCDAVALAVEGDGKRLLYTGDLRAHGRKGHLFQALIDRFAGQVDLLLVEGTTLGRPDGDMVTESDLEIQFVQRFRQQPSLSLVFCSSLNLDRIVTLYRAVKRTRKTMVVDLYTAYALREHLCVSKHFPQWDWPHIRVVPWDYQQNSLRRAGKSEFLEEIRPRWIGWREMKARRQDTVLLMRTNDRVLALERQFGDQVQEVDVIWSLWRGYWDDDRYVRPLCERHGIEPQFLHTSGHASWEDLKRLVEGIGPRTIVPVHTEHAARYAQTFPNVRLPDDGELLTV